MAILLEDIDRLNEYRLRRGLVKKPQAKTPCFIKVFEIKSKSGPTRLT